METTVPPGKGKKGYISDRGKERGPVQTDRQADRWVDRALLDKQDIKVLRINT